MKQLRQLTTVAFLLLTSAALAEPAPPVNVTSISGNVLMVRFSGNSVSYSENEGICIYRNRKAVACGYVVSADDSSVEIRVTRGNNKFVAEEKLLIRSSPRYARSDSGGGSRGRRRGAGSEKLIVALGTHIHGPSAMFIAGHLTLGYAVADNMVLSLQPFYTTSGAELSSKGAYVKFDYYFDKVWPGYFAFAGLGLYSISASATDPFNTVITESASSIAFKAGVGYRLVFGGNWHAGFELGLHYLNKTQGANLNFGYSSFNGVGTAEIGMLF